MSTLNVEFYIRDDYVKHMDVVTGKIPTVVTERLFVKIAQPGESHHNMIDRLATEDDKRQYARQYRQFERGEPQTVEGEPIETLFKKYSGAPGKLHFCGVHTVEQMAIASGNSLDAIGMGSQNWQNMAREWLKQNNSPVGMLDYKRDMERINVRIQALEDKVWSLAQRGE